MSETGSQSVPDATVRAAADAFGLDPETLASIGAFVSEVWSGTGPEGPVVLKVMDPGHRTLAEAEAEVAWQRALAQAGIPVARPIPSREGAFVVACGDPERLAVAYLRSPGRHLEPDAWTPQTFRAHGALVGSLQRHARGWHLPTGTARQGWLEHGTLDRVDEVFPGESEMASAVSEVAERVRVHVPTPPEHVGVIHSDLHAWNVLIDDDGGLTAIDFDDMVVGPYLYDLVIPLYYAVATRRGEESGRVADTFLTSYLEGFDALAPRPPGGAEAVDALLAMRQADLTVAAHLEVPEQRWDDALRATVTRLREQTIARHDVVPMDVLRRHFG